MLSHETQVTHTDHISGERDREIDSEHAQQRKHHQGAVPNTARTCQFQTATNMEPRPDLNEHMSCMHNVKYTNESIHA